MMLDDQQPFQSTGFRVEIAGANYAVPPEIETTQQLAQQIGVDADWLRSTSGVDQRHVSPADSDDPAQLAATAARPLVDRFGTPDLLLYCGALPRQVLPDTAAFVHRALDLRAVPGFSINAACLSFLAGLQSAQAMIRSGMYHNVLLVAAELASRGRDLGDPHSAALLGDGAAATWLRSAATDEHVAGPSLCRLDMETWSDGADAATVRDGGTLHQRYDRESTQRGLFQMNGPVLLRKTLPRLRRFLNAFLENHQLSIDDIDLIIPHQASAAGMEWLRRYGFPSERTVSILSTHGNCVASSIPMAFSHALDSARLRPGMRCLLIGTGAGI
ncbi:MAG: 3-oxoacyl-[acyl-carrier-protein] synthase III C-terminal domain-containing protein, partial [Planctomycetota bacterium]